MRVLVITHPEVLQDPATPVPRWSLAPEGIARMRAFARSAEAAQVASVWASSETKAIEAAGLLAAAHALPVGVEPDLHENDRSATGYLPPGEFEAVVDAFFAEPDRSVRGWERARDAQARFAGAVARILETAPPGDVALVAHGAVSALCLALRLGVPVSRSLEQPRQGSFWTFDRASGAVLTRWAPIAP